MIGKITTYLIVIQIVYSKITLENGLQSTQITLNDLKSFSQVLVEAKFNYIDNERYGKIHLVVRSANKHKKQAYVDLLKKFNGVTSTLIKMKAIPNKQSMIFSIVHRNYLKKMRKWQFSRYFVVYALKEEISQILKRLQQFRPEIVKTAPIVNYLDQKFMSIAAFIQAKLQLQKFIKTHLNGEYKILLTKDIQIIGQKLDNQQIIQDHIQEQFNQNMDGVSQETTNQIKQTQQIDDYYAKAHKHDKKQVKRLSMKVLFQLVQKSADIQDILEQLEGKGLQSQSISDFEAEIQNQQWKDKQDQKQQQEGEQIQQTGDKNNEL